MNSNNLNICETIKILHNFQKYRRGSEKLDANLPRMAGFAIDKSIHILRRLKKGKDIIEKIDNIINDLKSKYSSDTRILFTRQDVIEILESLKK